MTTPSSESSPAIPEKMLQEIEQRANAATPGPWVHDPANNGADIISHGIRGGMPVGRTWNGYQIDRNASANADFIAHARTDIPALLSAYRASQAALEERKAEVERLYGKIDAERARTDAEKLRASRLGHGIEHARRLMEKGLWPAADRVLSDALSAALTPSQGEP